MVEIINICPLATSYSKADYISQGSVATLLGCDGIFNDHLIATMHCGVFGE